MEKEWKRKKTPTKVFFSWTNATERPVSLTRAEPFGWINLAAAQIKCFNWLREYRRLKAARTEPPVNETWTVSRCFNEHRTCWNLVYHLQHCQRCRWRVWLSPCLMQQWPRYHLTTLHPFIQIGIFKPPLSNCPTCLPPRAESWGGTEMTWTQTTDPAAQWPAVLPVTTDTEVGCVELRVWSRRPYLILLRILDIRGWSAWRPLEIRSGAQSRVPSQVGLTGILPAYRSENEHSVGWMNYSRYDMHAQWLRPELLHL